MKIAILTRGSSGAYVLADAARSLGHQPLVGEFKTPQSIKELMACDVFIPRVSHTLYARAVQLTGEYAHAQPRGVAAVTAQGIERSFDKYAAYQDMARHNVPTPQTYLINSVADIAQYEVGLPLILKPRTENQGRNIAVVKTPAALASHARTLVNIYGSCIAQEFIAESAGRDIRAFVVGQEVVAAMERQAPEGTDLANLSRGGTAKVIELTSQEAGIAVKAAHLFGAEYAGVDLLRGTHGPVVIEVNVSPGLKIATITDRQIPTMIINHLVALKEQQ